MNLKHYAWFFKGALSDEMCDSIIKIGLSRKKEQGIIDSTNRGDAYGLRDLQEDPLSPLEKKQLLRKRNSHIVWLDEQWIFELINSYINKANQNAGWNFQWDWTESSQFTMYGKDQFYGWHIDAGMKPASNPNWKGSYKKTRKISSNIQLTDPSEYEGGLFQIDPRMDDPDKKKPEIWTAPRDRGTIICFPSFTWHRATPVTKGVRYSMTHWHWGQPWK